MDWRNNLITMKKQLQYIPIICLLLLIAACNSTIQNQHISSAAVIEVVPPNAMNNLLHNDPDAQLVDVRKSEEFQVSHLKDAQNICVTDTDFRDKAKNLDPNKPVYVYCKKGGRSAKAAKILKEMGFKEIYDLQGGIIKWKENDLEVTQ